MLTRACGACEHWRPGVEGHGLCGRQFAAVLDHLPYPELVSASDVVLCIEDRGSDTAQYCPWYQERRF